MDPVNDKNISEDNNYSQSFPIMGINIGVGVLALILNFTVFTIFITSKELRLNLFYRLLFVIYLFHGLSSLAIVVEYYIFLYKTNVKILCTMIPVLLSGMRMASILQTCIVAADRFQASLLLTKSVLHRRRSQLGKVSIILCLSVFLIFTIIGGVSGTDNCVSKQFYGNATGLISQLSGFWILIGIFLVEVPLCIATFVNIKKACTIIGVHINLMSYQRTRNDSEGNICAIYPPPTVQGNMKLKIQALKVLTLLVTTHVLIFIPQVVMVVIVRLTNDTRDHFYDYGVLLQCLNYLIDPIMCFLTVKPYQKAFSMLLINCPCNQLSYLCQLFKPHK